MKKLLFVIATAFLISGITLSSRAAFVIKNTAANVYTPANDSAASSGNNPETGDEYTNATAQWQQGPYGNGYHRGWEARVAMRFAFLGLFIAPFGILAIVHGARALSRSHGGRSDGMATFAIFLGSLEVLATIAFIIFFFAVIL